MPDPKSKNHRRLHRASSSSRFCESLESRLLLAATDPVINEFMALNGNTLADQDGEFSDWIEIYNPGTSTVNLDGWYLTDDAAELTKWRFPAVSLQANSYLIVWASSKDRAVAGQELHTNFKLDGDGEYLALVKPDGITRTTEFAPEYPAQSQDVAYGPSAGSTTEIPYLTQNSPAKAFIPSSNPLPNYTVLNFNDSQWQSGTLGVGYERTRGYESLIGLDVGAMYNKTASVLIRVPFTVNDPSSLDGLKLKMKYEDGFVAYINGQRVASDQAPGTLGWNSSTNNYNRDEQQAVTWREFDLSGYLSALQPGENVLAIHGLNSTRTSSDLLILPELDGLQVQPGSAQMGYLPTATPGRANFSQVLNLGPLITDVTYRPSTPNPDNIIHDSDAIIVNATVTPWQNAVGAVTLKYRVMYGAEISLAMLDDGLHGDGAAGDGVFGATIPASAASAGQMVRWYVVATDSLNQNSRYPLFPSASDSPEYDGTVIADPSVTSALPILQWFVQDTSLTTLRNGTRGSVFFLGQFYDNVEVRVRGGSAFGWPKPHLKFDFNPGYHFQFDVNQPRVEEFNLNSNYSDKSSIRSILSWETYRDAGSQFCISFPLRVQQNGTFYEVGFFVEQPDEDYLQRQGLDPDGALYKLTSDIRGSNFQTNPNGVVNTFEKKNGNPSDRSDLLALVNAIGQAQLLSGDQRIQTLTTYLFDYFDVPQMINQWAVNTIIHDNDDAQKNYYLYQDPNDLRWKMLPWDKDLTFGRNYAPGSGGVLSDELWSQHDPQSHPFFGDSEHPKIDGAHAWNAIIDALLDVPEIKQMYLRRLRSLMDQFLNGYYDQRINELYALMAPDMALDNAKWGQYGTYQTFATAIDLLKAGYLEPRRQHLYVNHALGSGYPDSAGIPGAQAGIPTINFGSFDYNPAGGQEQEYIQLVNPNSYAVDISGWRLTGGIEYTFEGGLVIPANGSIYVSPNIAAFRARTTGPRGGQGLIVVGPYANQLSAWGETVTLLAPDGSPVNTLTYTGNPSAAQRYLRITEVMYNPAPAAGNTPDAQQFEYVELQNIGAAPLNLLGVDFSAGIDYTFGNVTLSPGQYIVVAKDKAAFEARYGVGTVNVVAPYPKKYLNNTGDTVQLRDALGEEIQEFHYDPLWYPSTDGGGKSLVIIDPTEPLASWNAKESWRESMEVGGSPGEADVQKGKTITGTTGADVFTIRKSGGDLIVQIPGQPDQVFALSSVPNLRIVGGDGDDRLILDFSGGSMIPAGGLIFDSGAGADNVSITGTTVATGLSLADGQITVDGQNISIGDASVELAGADSSISVGSLSISGGRLMVAGSKKLLEVQSLALSGPGTLDIADNDLVVHSSAGNRQAVLNQLQGWISSARSTSANRWLGTGLTSSAAANQPLMGLGTMINEYNGHPLIGSLAGQNLGINDILVRYCFNGDMNFDGRINADDYFRIDSGFLNKPSPMGYREGDLNYDGRIDADDYFLIDSAFLGQGMMQSAASIRQPLSSAISSAKKVTAGRPRDLSLFSRNRVRRNVRRHV